MQCAVHSCHHILPQHPASISSHPVRRRASFPATIVASCHVLRVFIPVLFVERTTHELLVAVRPLLSEGGDMQLRQRANLVRGVAGRPHPPAHGNCLCKKAAEVVCCCALIGLESLAVIGATGSEEVLNRNTNYCTVDKNQPRVHEIQPIVDQIQPSS